jgi:Chalcone isomerase-like
MKCCVCSSSFMIIHHHFLANKFLILFIYFFLLSNKHMDKIFFTFLVMLFNISAYASAATFPLEVTVGEKQLQFTGEAIRFKYIVKVYELAHYMSDAHLGLIGNLTAEILENKGVKQLTFRWLRDVQVRTFREGLQESFYKAVPDKQRRRVQGTLLQFIQLYDQDIKKGDEHRLIWLPDGRIILYINDLEKSSILNQEFAVALWSLWLGPQSIVDKKSLLSRMIAPVND